MENVNVPLLPGGTVASVRLAGRLGAIQLPVAKGLMRSWGFEVPRRIMPSPLLVQVTSPVFLATIVRVWVEPGAMATRPVPYCCETICQE